MNLRQLKDKCANLLHLPNFQTKKQSGCIDHIQELSSLPDTDKIRILPDEHENREIVDEDKIEDILSFKALENVFDDCQKINEVEADRLRVSIEAFYQESHKVLSSTLISRENILVALFKEQLHCRDMVQHYLKVFNQMTVSENEMLQFSTTAPDLFFDTFNAHLDLYLNNKKMTIFNDINNESSWYTSFTDTFSKTIGQKSLVETQLEKHLSNDVIKKDLTKMLESATEDFKKAWETKISSQTQLLKTTMAASIAGDRVKGISVPFQPGEAEQVLITGMGAAIVGTVGLALGWHTLTYALMTVFPPIAAIAAVVAIAIGVINKEKAIEQRQKQIEEVIRLYQLNIVACIEMQPIKELGNITIRRHLDNIGKEIMLKVNEQWSKFYLGSFNKAIYKDLVDGITAHEVKTVEAINAILK